MSKKILILSGSPKKDGNTAALIEWFKQGALLKGAQIEVVSTAFLKCKSNGCTSCRMCQKNKEYGCVIDDDVRPVLRKMLEADVIVMATPLYFFGPSAQTKIVFDRMFSLYKWDNDNGTMQTPLKGKIFVLMASAFEAMGLDALEKPFSLTAEYTGMAFESLLVANAGVSGAIKANSDARQKAIALGEKVG
ncbi:MAG: flavodoxin family protein [Candidatus Omnitrophota bacterium]